eukprot:TRINITY_DN22696_c0_g2_i1.p2 TRINITY_DN22696_c0_g2~~TRINITY_DN22696_c0_g2_i1.p2  ORF type:complete len:297 (+),score=107.55 TRINITY_DN22696_c0_g2_i1:85-891(+)
MRAAAPTLLAVAASAAQVHVPGGRLVDERCVVTLPNGAGYAADEPRAIPGCKTDVAAPRIQIYAADVHYESSEPLTSFTADWTVPPLPAKAAGQVVYFWPGFKSKQPEMGYPVLQPVLQYGEHGAGWQLQSWFVDARDPFYPVVTAPAIKVSPGDQITSFMQLSKDGTMWTVSGTDVTTGQNSTLHIQYKKAGNCNYDYAMLVNENINVNTECDRMPPSDALTFTKVSVNGKLPPWVTRADCAGNQQCDCGNKAAVAKSGDVTLSWTH